MKTFKEFAHLYIGCEVQTNIRKTQGQGKPSIKLKGKLMEVDLFKESTFGILLENETDKTHYCYLGVDEFKPLLRLLKDATQIEHQEYADFFSVRYLFDNDNELTQHAFATTFLLSKSFDLFNLIPSGLALDATTIKNEKP
jgi:hypothetical protein